MEYFWAAKQQPEQSQLRESGRNYEGVKLTATQSRANLRANFSNLKQLNLPGSLSEHDLLFLHLITFAWDGLCGQYFMNGK